MMMPSLSTLSSSSSSASSRVEKATSELLVGPDWTLNLEICDICNSNHWLAKDMVKAVKKRLQHKNPKVQLLSLTLLETMMKNCGEYIHFHLAERKVIDEMIKIVKKKGDMHVRDKILILLDSWQEAFGGPSGKYPQYYWACDELRRYGIQFPQRSQHTAPILTPPVTHPSRVAQVGFGMQENSSRRLDEAMTSEVEGLSLSALESMWNTLELLNDMLQAVNPNDRLAVKDEVIVDLVDGCRTNQKKLMQMISATTDEELLAQGLEMNDSLQTVLAKHDAIASGAPLPIQSNPSGQSSISLNSKDRDKNPAPNSKPPSSAEPPAKDQGEEGEEEDEFAQLARRHSKATPPQSASMGAVVDDTTSGGSDSNALVLVDAPAPATATATTTTKEQDLIDLLSIVLSTSSTSSETPQNPPKSTSAETPAQESFNSYVVPWAQPQPQTQPQQPPRPVIQYQTSYQSTQPQLQQQTHQGYSQFSSSVYPPPPWEGASGYPSNQNLAYNPYTSQGNTNNSSTWPSQNSNLFQGPQYGYYQPKPLGGSTAVYSSQNPTMNSNQHATSQAGMNSSSLTMQGTRTPQHPNSLSEMASNGLAMNGSVLTNNNGSSTIPLGQKPYVPSYRLFEDLNVFGGTEGKMKSNPYPSASGNPNQNMLAGRR